LSSVSMLFTLLWAIRASAEPSPLAGTTVSEPCSSDGWCWSRVPDGITIRALWGKSDNDLWGVGYWSPHGNDARGAIIHFDGARWSVEKRDLVDGLDAMIGFSGRDIWAVGGCSAVHFDGPSWRAMQIQPSKNPCESLFGLWGTSGRNLWA